MNLTQRFLDIVGRIMPDNGRDEISELYELLDDAIGVTDSVMSLLGRETPECHGYSEIDAGIRQLDPQVMSTRAIVSVLASTFSKRTCLPSRSEFFRRASEHLRRSEPDRAGALLKGLE